MDAVPSIQRREILLEIDRFSADGRFAVYSYPIETVRADAGNDLGHALPDQVRRIQAGKLSEGGIRF
jgi:hypothetical protein